MKAKLLRDERITHPDLKSFGDLKALAHRYHSGEIDSKEWDAQRHVDAKAGTVIDHPQAFWLVVMGRAEPADEACKRAAASRMAAGLPSFDANLIAANEGADRLDRAQITGDENYDASDEQVEAFKAKREAQMAAAQTSES